MDTGLTEDIMSKVRCFIDINRVECVEIGGSYGYGTFSEQSDVDVFVYPHLGNADHRFGFSYRRDVDGVRRRISVMWKSHGIHDIIKDMDVRRFVIYPVRKIIGSRVFENKSEFFKEYQRMLVERKILH